MLKLQFLYILFRVYVVPTNVMKKKQRKKINKMNKIQIRQTHSSRLRDNRRTILNGLYTFKIGNDGVSVSGNGYLYCTMSSFSPYKTILQILLSSFVSISISSKSKTSSYSTKLKFPIRNKCLNYLRLIEYIFVHTSILHFYRTYCMVICSISNKNDEFQMVIGFNPFNTIATVSVIKIVAIQLEVMVI